MTTLVLIRHGESLWNLQNRFTGWTDVDLTAEGVAQMQRAGVALRAANWQFDVAYTSALKRCIRSLWILFDTMDCMWVSIRIDWRLNERHYGALTSLDKDEARKLYGINQVEQWRRSYAIRPPLSEASEALNTAINFPYMKFSDAAVPLGESLHDTVQRVRRVWDELILTSINTGQRVIFMGHGNSIRALIKDLEGLSDDAIAELEIPNAVPLVYELDSSLKPTSCYRIEVS